MSTHPIDIIAAAIRAAGPVAAGHLAEDVAKVIATDERFVADAVVALRHSGWVDRDGVTAEAVARVVLRSVGGE